MCYGINYMVLQNEMYHTHWLSPNLILDIGFNVDGHLLEDMSSDAGDGAMWFSCVMGASRGYVALPRQSCWTKNQTKWVFFPFKRRGAKHWTSPDTIGTESIPVDFGARNLSRVTYQNQEFSRPKSNVISFHCQILLFFSYMSKDKVKYRHIWYKL